jgi:DNA-binding transcriptional MerR regulator
MTLRIGEFSCRGHVSAKALRHYETVGLLKPGHVDAATGYRYYLAAEVDDLHRLTVLRARRRGARDAGGPRLEGKEYAVKDGDHFRFNI